MTRLAKYLRRSLTEQRWRQKPGWLTGLRQCGPITVALTAERQEEFGRRQARDARVFGVEVGTNSPRSATSCRFIRI